MNNENVWIAGYARIHYFTSQLITTGYGLVIAPGHLPCLIGFYLTNLHTLYYNEYSMNGYLITVS